MTVLAEKVYQETLTLPIEDRVQLAERLLHDLTPLSAEIEAAWIVEAQSRVTEYKAGNLPTLSGEEVFGDIFTKLEA